MKNLETLNETFGNNCLSFVQGENNFIKAVLKTAAGSSADIYLYGGHVTSWVKSGSGELLFMSKKAEFQKGKGIRGGIPVIFPQFGGGGLPNHGFVRNKEWECISAEVLNGKDIKVVLEIKEDSETLKLWPFPFSLKLEITLTESLDINFIVTNTGKEAFSFTDALHTYFKVGDISEVEVTGLKGLTYLDKVNNFAETPETQERASFDRFFDRVYKNSPDKVELHDKKLNRIIIIEKINFTDSILWNPWEGSVAMKDMHENAYKEMICIESGNAASRVELKPGAVFSASQTISVR